MNEENLNMEIRKFLKKVGITSQGILEREILSNKEKSKVNQGDEIELEMRLLIKSFDYENTITGKIKIY